MILQATNVVLPLSVKAIRRVAQQCGDDLLKLRTMQLNQWRAGTLKSTGELAGKRVSVQIDGGRTKIRGTLRASSPEAEKRSESGLLISDAPGRSKSVQGSRLMQNGVNPGW